jgi:hypothetical protein
VERRCARDCADDRQARRTRPCNADDDGRCLFDRSRRQRQSSYAAAHETLQRSWNRSSRGAVDAEGRSSMLGAMSPGSSNHRRRIRLRQRQRCGAMVKNLLKGRAHGLAILRNPFCKAWAMPNGRCRVHGGASTGPRSPRARRASWPRWSRDGASGFDGDARRG